MQRRKGISCGIPYFVNEIAVAIQTIFVEFDISSLTSFNERRDALLKSDEFFNVAQYPKATLKFKMIDGEILIASVTIRDATKPVDFEYFFIGKSQDEAGKPSAAIRLSATLNRQDFGLSYNVTAQDGTDLLGETVTVVLDLYGKK